MRAKACFDSAKARGEEYLLIMEKPQENAEPLIVATGGTEDEVKSVFQEFRKGFGFSYVAMLRTQTLWDEQQEYLDSIGFVW